MVPSKVATATELSNGSCSQRSRAGVGVMESPVWMSRRSWLCAGAEHHTMLAQTYGLGVAVDGDVAYGEKRTSGGGLRHFIRPDLETFERIRAERGCDGDIGSIAAPCH